LPSAEALESCARKARNTKKVGLVSAFTGHYLSVQVLGRFLELAGMEVVRSRITTPRVIEAGTTLSSADFCIPLRTYVGHVFYLLSEHPDIEALVAPNVLSEDGLSSTCSKYRDVGGVAIRSLSHSLGYLLARSDRELRSAWCELLPPETLSALLERGRRIPEVVMVDLRSLGRDALFQACFEVYAQLAELPPFSRLLRLLPRESTLLRRLREAFEAAYRQVVEERPCRAYEILSDPRKPRLAIVGRRYLVHDPSLTCDLKPWFERRGVAVVTAQDVPREELFPLYARVDGYYDTHKEGQALIDWAADKVDGFISVGSFGCHPDAFQTDFLADYARRRGLPCWVLRYDENAGAAGFHTRYETILAFLEERRDLRLRGEAPQPIEVEGLSARRVSGRPGEFSDFPGRAGREAAVRPRPKKPLLVWPYMGEILNLIVEEACHQLGLSEYFLSPVPLTEETMEAGNDRYTESCSPYACSTGTLKSSIARALDLLEEEARRGRAEPRRIIALMARGEGPCTFGWYAIVQALHLPEEFSSRLRQGGHTLEFATMGLDGFGDFIRDLSEIGDREKLRPVLDYVQAWERGFEGLSRFRRSLLRLRLLRFISGLLRPLWAKLDAAEDLRRRSLLLRAHDRRFGDTDRAYRQALELLRQAHSVEEIREAHRRGVELLERVPRDFSPRPRVVVVGEIYVALTSFANRGTVENLLGREGVEVVEGVTLGGFVRHSLREMKRRARRNHPLLRPLLDALSRRGVKLLEQRIRDPEARPFLVHEVGGDGLLSVAHARHEVEEGADGILHLFPFKCMPEGIAKDAVKEIADLYGVRYLSLSFDKETDIERLKTEVSTFASLLRAEMSRRGGGDPSCYWAWKRAEISRRKRIGEEVARLYQRYRRSRLTD